jgi:hypothetical protein
VTEFQIEALPSGIVRFPQFSIQKLVEFFDKRRKFVEVLFGSNFLWRWHTEYFALT